LYNLPPNYDQICWVMTMALATLIPILNSNSDKICTWKDTGFGTRGQ
jgi:hypothetical protein